MRSLSFLFFVIILSLCGIMLPSSPCMAADKVDDEGYPLMYLRGENIAGGWNDSNETYQFTRNGDNYTLTIDYLDGQFKISGTDWRCNYGGTEQGVTIAGTTEVEGVQDGHNYKAETLENVTISFTLQLDGQKAAPTTIHFATSSTPPPVSGLSGTLPVLYIKVYRTDSEGNLQLDSNGNKQIDNEIIDKDLNHKNTFQAEYWLDMNNCQWLIDQGGESIGSEEEPLATEIRARGNYTRTAFAKKPFKLKLAQKQNLLNLTPEKSKHYILMAHADDGLGYLRNFTGFNLGCRIGLPWTPSMQPLELVINGSYHGLYFLTESVRFGKGRINVEDGFLVELDNYDEENQIRINEKSCVSGHNLDRLRITFHEPELCDEQQKQFLTEQFTAMNNAVGSNSDNLWDYMHLDDAVRYYLVKEAISDTESYHGSTYLYRDNGDDGKWHFSPLWDCGQAFNGSTSAFFYNNDPFGNTWIPSIRQNETFNRRLKEIWLDFVANRYPGIIDDIDEYVAHISVAARADRRRWKDAPTPNGGTQVQDNSDMQQKRNHVVNLLEAKMNWLKTQFGTPSCIDTTNMQVDKPAVQYYDLTGRKIYKPTPGTICIERRGNIVRKCIILQ